MTMSTQRPADRPIIGQRVVRRLLQRYWRLTRGLTLGVRGIVVNPDGRVLLVRHTYMPGWQLPGGGVERGESALAALTRELDEEAGVTIDGAPRMLGIYDNGAAFPGDHVLVYVVREWRRERIPPPNREIAASEFFRPEALPEGTTAGTRRRIVEMASGAQSCQTW